MGATDICSIDQSTRWPFFMLIFADFFSMHFHPFVSATDNMSHSAPVAQTLGDLMLMSPVE